MLKITWVVMLRKGQSQSRKLGESKYTRDVEKSLNGFSLSLVGFEKHFMESNSLF